MTRAPFTFQDLAKDCAIQTACYNIDEREIGAKVIVPNELQHRYPYCASAYVFLQQLRSAIFEFGVVEFPNLPVNKTNHTLAQRSPKEHTYSSNTYLTDLCQQPHQDTPPLPTAFWLGEKRNYFATWVMSTKGVEEFYAFAKDCPQLSVEEVHKIQVAQSLKSKSGFLMNQNPGLVLLDNSDNQSLYHARTCCFQAVEENPDYTFDTPMYAYSEIGLLNYIDSIDSRRCNNDRDARDLEDVKAFMAAEKAGRV